MKLFRHVTILAERVGGIHAALTDRDTAEDIVRWIGRNYDNEETNQDYRVALKVLGRRVSDENGSDPPDALDWIPSGASSNYDPAPEPRQMLNWNDDSLPMIEATDHKRDAVSPSSTTPASGASSSATSPWGTSLTTTTAYK